MSKTFFITTAIDYTNSPPHIGHAYEKVLADVIARYHRLKGEEVFFLTGVDQHGQKVQQSAAKAGIAPAEFVKDITEKFVDLWQKLDVRYDEWAETTSKRHKKVVQGILQRLFEEGEIYKDKQAGYYSVRQEQFLTDKERGPDGEFGLEWGEIEFREEENYYFKLSQHKEWLLRYIEDRKDAIIPDFRQTELRNAVEKISGDLCISRPKSRLDWGIELPFDKDFVTYVWFDALTNYISFAGYDPNGSAVATGLRPVETDASSKSLGTAHRAVATSEFDAQPQEFRDRWSKDTLQTIGKDILIPAHGIYWLIMLHAIGFPDDQMPQLLVHGWWNLGGAKMSKSTGNIIDPFVLAEKYGAEAVRYYLMSDIATGYDADFLEVLLRQRHDSELSNSLGNLLNRTLPLLNKYQDGLLHRVEPTEKVFLSLRTLANDTVEWFCEAIEKTFSIHSALAFLHNFVRRCNEFAQETSPWKLVTDSEHEERLNASLYHLSESLRMIAILISPVLPKAAHGIFDQLNWKMEKELSGKEKRFSLKDAKWGCLPDGHVVGKPVPLFPRIEQ